eukprot:IDg8916t1
MGVRVGRNSGDIESQKLMLSPARDAEDEAHIGKFLHINIGLVGAPQRLSLSLAIDTDSRKVQLRISKKFGSQDELRFDWQMWKDAFMGRMQGQKEWRITINSVENDELQSDAAYSDLNDLVAAIEGGDVSLLGNHYGSGWSSCYPRMKHAMKLI